MKANEVRLLQEQIKVRYDEAGLDYKTFKGDIDTTLTYEEQKRITTEELNKILPKEVPKLKRDTIMPREQLEALQQQQISQFEKQAELEFNRVLEKIGEDKTTATIDDIYYIPKQFTKMVANGFSRGFLLFGEAGIGKTYSVIKAFKEAKKEFVMLSGHITALELYHFLFENRDANVVLDDVNILETEQNLNMLKACLSDNSRVVSYHTSSSKLKVPNKFVFNGTITLLLNRIPKQAESLKAVESRILNYEMKMDYTTKIKIVFELAKSDYKGLTQDERFMIAKWIRENTNEATENLNLRLLFTCYEFYRFDKANWEKLARGIIRNNEEYMLIIQRVSQPEWSERTGLSRRSYFNYKSKLVQKCNEKGI